MDEVALYSVSPSWMADKITSIIEDVAGDHVVVSAGVYDCSVVGGVFVRNCLRYRPVFYR